MIALTPISAFAQFSGAAPIDSPQTDLTPIGPPGLGGLPSRPAANPAFDPYATGGPLTGSLGAPIAPTPAPPFASPPGGGSGYPGGSFFGRLFSRTPSVQSFPGGSMAFPSGSMVGGPTTLAPPAQQLPPIGYPPAAGGLAPPTYGSPGFSPPPTAFAPPTTFGGGAYPSSVYPANTPSTLFPGGLFGGAGIGGVFTQDPTYYDAYRLFQGTRFRHLFIGGGDGSDEVGHNHTDVSVAFAFQNFLYSSRPLYVVPSFGLHLWNGPSSDGGPTDADLPSAVYDGFLDFGWQSDPNQMLGAELGLRVGVFTDFNVMNGDSLRVRGKGLGSFRLTPASTLKVGVYYLDRNTVKLLPAGGLLWQPSPATRFDIFFPEPKLARYWRTIGTQDVWWYLGGEYGGGAWTIERDNGDEDNVEMNEIRTFVGLEWGRSEWIRTGRRRAFVEIGYVFDREVNYEESPEDDFSPDGAIMFRGGFGY